MTGPTSRYESLVDQQIGMAQERGEFDNLPGLGQPLPDRGEQDDELWWVKSYLRREGLTAEGLLPASLQLAREVEHLPEAAARLRSERAVREAVASLNRRIEQYRKAPTSPYVKVKSIDVDVVIQRWRTGRR